MMSSSTFAFVAARVAASTSARKAAAVVTAINTSICMKSPAAAPIKDGKYTVKVLPGAKKVRINASRQPAKPDPVMGAAARESMVQPQYNLETTLTADVKPGKQEGVDFKVKSIPR